MRAPETTQGGLGHRPGIHGRHPADFLFGQPRGRTLRASQPGLEGQHVDTVGSQFPMQTFGETPGIGLGRRVVPDSGRSQEGRKGRGEDDPTPSTLGTRLAYIEHFIYM